MSDLVDHNEIEKIVGQKRALYDHIVRMVTSEERVYIMHSIECEATQNDLRDCEYSLALDQGINPEDWDGYEDKPTPAAIYRWDEDTFWLEPRRDDAVST